MRIFACELLRRRFVWWYRKNSFGGIDTKRCFPMHKAKYQCTRNWSLIEYNTVNFDSRIQIIGSVYFESNRWWNTQWAKIRIWQWESPQWTFTIHCGRLESFALLWPKIRFAAHIGIYNEDKILIREFESHEPSSAINSCTYCTYFGIIFDSSIFNVWFYNRISIYWTLHCRLHNCNSNTTSISDAPSPVQSCKSVKFDHKNNLNS